MSLDIIVGAQWGDEGKGRMVDLLAAEADYVARYSGGDNAGHTVTVGEDIFKLHLLPSGVIRPRTIGVLGNGLVITDTGIGLIEESNGGLGLANIKERLDSLYGGDAQLILKTNHPQGLKAIVEVPHAGH